MNDIIPVEAIAQKIYLVRGQKVMLDKDLAILYGVQMRALNQAVKRNKTRFPEDFMFKLNEKEIELMVSQNVIPSKQVLGGYFPFVFTEQGVAMLSGVLKSKRAIHVNIMIMRAFVKIRDLMSSQRKLGGKINEMKKKYDKKFAIVFTALKQLIKAPDTPAKKQFWFRTKK